MQFLWHALKWFAVIAVTALVFIVIGVLFRLSWLISLVMLALSISTVVLLLSCLPLGALATMVVENVRAVRIYLQIVGGFLIWLLLLTFYFSVLPVSNNPGAIIIMVLLFSITALLGAIYGIELDAKRIYASVAIIFLITIIGFSLPKTFGEIFSMKGRLDEILSECIKAQAHAKTRLKQKHMINLLECTLYN
jgi:hypothetical protein